MYHVSGQVNTGTLPKDCSFLSSGFGVRSYPTSKTATGSLLLVPPTHAAAVASRPRMWGSGLSYGRWGVTCAVAVPRFPGGPAYVQTLGRGAAPSRLPLGSAPRLWGCKRPSLSPLSEAQQRCCEAGPAPMRGWKRVLIFRATALREGPCPKTRADSS